MLTRRPTTSSFDPTTGRRLKQSSSYKTPQILHIQRQSFIPSFSSCVPPALARKFKRPMTKRRSYDKNAEVALKQSSLGQRRRMDGMSKLMARAGKGLTYKLPDVSRNDDGSEESGDSDKEEEEVEKERPFEPLLVWQSPHNGGELKGLPPKL